MFRRIPHAVQVSALETAEALWNDEDFLRRIAPHQFRDDPEGLATRLAQIDEAQATAEDLYQFTQLGMPSC